MPVRSFWFSRSPVQAHVEALLIGGVLWLLMLIGQISAHLTVNGGSQWELSFYLNISCLTWLLFRMTPAQHVVSKAALQRFLTSLLVLLLLQLCYTLSLYLLLLPHGSSANREQFVVMLLISLGTTLFWLPICTGLADFLYFWNRLRQQSLQWSLIHAHLRVIVVVVGISSLVYLLSLSGPFRSGDRLPTLDFTLLSSLFLLALAIILILIVVLVLVTPPLALFAYFVTRPTVKRIAALVTATDELRKGHYSVRAPLEGMDEIARLQQNFNSMADELEKTIHELQTERDHVASLLNERRELFANVSHELRTPIATLRGYLESNLNNREHVSPSALWEDMEILEREVQQLQERSDELFNLSKAEVEPVALAIGLCDVHSLVQTLVKSYAPLAWRGSKVEIVADMPDEVPLVNADEQHLEQALKNIVRNALRHTPPGGVIALVVTIEPKRVGISVEDTGEGIAPEALAHIWERFYQARTPGRQEGAGIGLSLVKEWITSMGGSVAATSTPGEGSCFTIYLPRLDQLD